MYSIEESTCDVAGTLRNPGAHIGLMPGLLFPLAPISAPLVEGCCYMFWKNLFIIIFQCAIITSNILFLPLYHPYEKSHKIMRDGRSGPGHMAISTTDTQH